MKHCEPVDRICLKCQQPFVSFHGERRCGICRTVACGDESGMPCHGIALTICHIHKLRI